MELGSVGGSRVGITVGFEVEVGAVDCVTVGVGVGLLPALTVGILLFASIKKPKADTIKIATIETAIIIFSVLVKRSRLNNFCGRNAFAKIFL